MTAPANIAEFLTLVQQSGLVPATTLAEYMHQHRSTDSLFGTPAQMAEQMVQDGILTPFQSEQILHGRWRRFSFGRYKVLEQLGAGGMGAVYLCEHKHMHRKVAVKVLPIARNLQGSCLERFYREARAAAALNHPNIVRAYDIDEDDSMHFLAMEYVEGASLSEIVKKNGPLAPLQAVHYMRQAALGLQHAYEAGLVHRDIKPANLLVDLTATVKILDLGLARFYADDTDDVSIKHDERVLGTVDFLAPEQAINSHDVDIRADIYSLGCTFYYCLTGRPPFPNGTSAQKLVWHQSRFPQPISDYRGDVPAELIAVLDHAMAKRPKDRYQTPADLVQALEALPILAGDTKATRGDKTLTKPSQWWPDGIRPTNWSWRKLASNITSFVDKLVAAVGRLLERKVGAKEQPAEAREKERSSQP